jgi:hypothetical protein
MQDGFKKFKRFSFRNPKPKRMPFAGGGVSGDGGLPGTWIDGHFYSSGDHTTETPSGTDPSVEPTPIPYGGNPEGQPSTSASGSTNNFTPPMDIPFGPYPGLPGVMPDGSYNGPGSGAPTRNIVGLGAGLAGNLLFPGAGLLTGSLAKLLMQKMQGPVGRVPGQQVAPTQSSQPQGGGSSGPSQGLGFWGQNPGDNPQFVQNNRPEGFDPNAPGANTYGGGPLSAGPNEAGWTGGSAFGGRGMPIVPGSGFLNNQGSLPTLGGGASDYGAKIALHSGRFRDAVANAPYINPNFGMPLPKGGGQGIGGAGRPMTQNYAGGGVAKPAVDAVEAYNAMLQPGVAEGQPQGAETKAGLFDTVPNTTYKGKELEDRDDAEKELAPVNTVTDEDRVKAYGTIGVNIDGQEMEVPQWNIDMTPAEAEDAARMRLEWGLSPFATDEELEEKQNAAHRGPDDNTAGQDDLTYRPNMTPEDMANRYAETSRPKPKSKQDISFARGGMVRPVPMQQQVQGYGTDTVPAALTPGELVLNKQQEAAVMPRPGMKRVLKPEQRAAIEIAMRKRKQAI